MNYKFLIIAVLIAGLTIVGASISIGINVRDVEVEDNAYNASLSYDHLRNCEAKLGWQIDVPRTSRLGGTLVPVTITDKTGKPVQGALVDLELSSLAGHRVDRYHATEKDPGRYVIEAHFDRQGYWDAVVQVNRRDDTFRSENKIYIP